MHIIVPTCAAYSDAWIPFYALFAKYWPDCPFPITLATDRWPDNITIPEPWRRGEVFAVGNDKGWCANFLAALQHCVKDDLVLMLQEDFWLNFPTNTAEINRFLDVMKADPKVGAFRIYPCPGPELPAGPGYGLLRPGADYRVSCQATIWRKSELELLLSKFNTPREFEIDGTKFVNSERSHIKYLAVQEPDPNKWPIQYYCTAIIRGEYDPGAIEFCQRQGVPVDLSRRSVTRGPR